MKKTKWKGGALIAPLPPVMVSCGTPEQPNVLTVAWTGITTPYRLKHIFRFALPDIPILL